MIARHPHESGGDGRSTQRASPLDAVERGRYLVFTSHDTRILYALQSFCPPAYRFVMRQLNRQLTAIGEQASSGDSSQSH